MMKHEKFLFVWPTLPCAGLMVLFETFSNAVN